MLLSRSRKVPGHGRHSRNVPCAHSEAALGIPCVRCCWLESSTQVLGGQLQHTEPSTWGGHNALFLIQE